MTLLELRERRPQRLVFLGKMSNAHQQFSLKWNNYSQHIVTALEELRVDDELTDVTLSSDGQRVKAHKVLLSACSVFFKETFKVEIVNIDIDGRVLSLSLI